MTTTMTKEEILATLKVLILDIMDNSEKFQDDISFQKEWQNKQQEVGISVKKLNSCDALWLNDEYAEWFNTEVKPNIKDIDPSVRDRLLWQ